MGTVPTTTTQVLYPPAPDINIKPSPSAANTIKRVAAVVTADVNDEDGRTWTLRKKTAKLGDI